MGSDMSRPRNRRNASADAFRERGGKNLVCKEVDCDYMEAMSRRRPCYPTQPDTVRRLPPVDPCDPCRNSRCSTPTQCHPCGVSSANFVDVPVDTKYYRPSRYQTSRPCYREDDFYLEPKQLSVKKSYVPYIYDDCDRISTKLPPDCDIIPAEKIYEIRKEKVLIKTDRSQSPSSRIRSKSTDRYLEVPRSVRVINNDSYRAPKPIPVDVDTTRARLRSRSGYMEETHIRSESSERKVVQENTLNNTLLNQNKSQLCLNNDIIYVPMVREEFIKRESKKLNNESEYGESESYRRRPNKIIIREVEQPNLKPILKTSLSSNSDEIFVDRVVNESSNNENRLSNNVTPPSPNNNDSKQHNNSNLKFGLGKDGCLVYTYE